MRTVFIWGSGPKVLAHRTNTPTCYSNGRSDVRYQQHDFLFAETIPQTLPNAPSLSAVKHSCKPNVAVWELKPVVDINGAPMGNRTEYMALRRIAVGEELLVDHLGYCIKPREERQKLLRQAGHLGPEATCACPRCTAADLEGALVCPKCLPFEEREEGFCLPEAVVQQGMVNDDEGPGHIVRDVKDRWHCSKCQCEFSNEQVDVSLPGACGAPASSHLGLARYATSLYSGLETREAAEIPLETREQMRQAVIMTVGTKHFATSFDLLLSIQQSDPAEVEVALGLLSMWIEEWLTLDPVLYIGPDKLMHAAGILEVAGKRESALPYYEKVKEAVPTWNKIYVDAAAAAKRCKAACC